jgi:uncharacterized protein (TIGR03382 family)
MGIDGFSVGYSDDNGATFQRLMNFIDLLGPLTCAPVSSNCQAHWERIQGVLGIAPAPDGGSTSPDGGTTPPDAGSGGTDAGRPDSGTPSPSGGGTTKSGCSATNVDAGSLGVLITALLLWEFRRRGRGH